MKNILSIKVIINTLIAVLLGGLLGWGIWATDSAYCANQNKERIQENKEHIERLQDSISSDLKEMKKTQKQDTDRIMDKLMQIQREMKK